MEILTNFEVFDCILVGIIVLFTILGFKRGFILCIYNFTCTIFCLLGAYFCTNSSNEALEFVTTNQYIQEFDGFFKEIIIFIIFFFLLSILVKVVNIFLKPIINGIAQHVIIIKQLNQLLGFLLGAIRGIIYGYIIVMIMLLPIVESGPMLVSNSEVAKLLLEVVPMYSEQIMETYFL